MSTAIRAMGRLFLAAVLGACSTTVESGGSGGGGESLDVEIAADGGLRATTAIDGETIVIEARAVVEPAVMEDGTPFDDEYLIATITGAEPYADVRLGVMSDVITGTLAGRSVAGALSGEATGDWTELAASRAGAVLTEVSRRADATVAAGTYLEVERQLALVAEPGPLLQTLATLVGGEEAICGDGECSVDETDEVCPEDCGCAAAAACGGVAPFGCFCGEDCAENGDCCADACLSCGAGCPACPEGEVQCNPAACAPEQMACDDGTCLELSQLCDGAVDCAGGEDELCTCAYCSG